LLAFQIADVEVEVACLVDNVRVLIFGWAGVDELAVPVLEGQPLEFRVLFEIEEGDSVYSLVVRVARNVYSTVVAGPATDDAGGTIVYRGEHCLASCLHIVDADASVLVVSCSGKSEFFPVEARLQGGHVGRWGRFRVCLALLRRIEIYHRDSISCLYDRSSRSP